MLAGAVEEQKDYCPPPRKCSPDELLDIQKALQIVTEHYGRRNATLLSCCIVIASSTEALHTGALSWPS